MKTQYTPFDIKFAPEHFPQGTKFTIGDNLGFKNNIFETVKVIKNGYKSYIIETSAPYVYIGGNRSFNIDYISNIVVRGTGPVIIDDHWSGDSVVHAKMLADKQKTFLLNVEVKLPSFKTHYIFDYYDFKSLLLSHRSMLDLNYTTCLNIIDLSDCFFKQSFVKQHKLKDWETFFHSDFIFSAPKKRVNRWIKQNINRFLKNVSKAEKDNRDLLDCNNDILHVDGDRLVSDFTTIFENY